VNACQKKKRARLDLIRSVKPPQLLSEPVIGLLPSEVGGMKVLNTHIGGRESGLKSHTKVKISNNKKMHVYSATYKK